MTADELFLDDEFDDQPEPEPDPEPEPEPEPEFTSVYEFVERHLVFVYARKLTHKPDRRWCPRWFEHAEAVSRLEALWRAYESLRLDPGTGMSVWWRDHADHHMSALFAPDGPFESCTADRGHNADLAPIVLPTEEMDDPDLRLAMSTLAPETVS